MKKPTTAWAVCKRGMICRVKFSLGVATVRLLSTFVYKSGRMFHVEDIVTGRKDYVGIEHLAKVQITKA